ncbi:hypothetical protein Vretifemale_17761 [Volvox reticuliferus]|nr:hypothetical protein Vretifemale_17761 [Volvox reticuliferus]
MASWRQRRYGHEWRPHQRASPAPLTFQRRASAANPLGRPSASLVGPGGSEGTASLQVNVSRSAGTGGAYEEHHCDLDDGDAAAGRRDGGGGSPLGGSRPGGSGRCPRRHLAGCLLRTGEAAAESAGKDAYCGGGAAAIGTALSNPLSAPSSECRPCCRRRQGRRVCTLIPRLSRAIQKCTMRCRCEGTADYCTTGGGGCGGSGIGGAEDINNGCQLMPLLSSSSGGMRLKLTYVVQLDHAQVRVHRQLQAAGICRGDVGVTSQQCITGCSHKGRT